MKAQRRPLFLFSSPSCELCDAAEALFHRYENERASAPAAHRFKLIKINILTAPLLKRRYAWSIPVLYRPARGVFDLDSLETSDLLQTNLEASDPQTSDLHTSGLVVSDTGAKELHRERPRKVFGAGECESPQQVSRTANLAQQFLDLLSEEILCSKQSNGSAVEPGFDLSLPIQEGGIKLDTELYWPFPLSRLRDFLADT